jgi:penicillin-binding protein 2
MLAMDMPDPKKKTAELNTEISKLAVLLGMTTKDLNDAYNKAKTSPYTTYAIKEDVKKTDVEILKEHSSEYPGIEVETTFLRNYPNGSLGAQLLGYVGEMSSSDSGLPQFKALANGSHIGLGGVERQYDSLLRGTDGKKTYSVDSSGRPKGVEEDVPAKAGNNLVLTIDSDLQKAAEKAIVEAIDSAHKQGFPKAAAGAVVAMDPNNGQVLAMASYPSTDPSVWVGGMSTSEYNQLKNAPNNPQVNRALNGLYPAGSTFKPFVAAAALNAGLITKDNVFHDSGTFTRSGTTWKDWKAGGHGDVSLVTAIEESCDVYFYNVGSLAYDRQGPVLETGLRLFGFGSSTGVDLPGETTHSRVPDSTWKASYYKKDNTWKPGDDINLSIGQGDLLVTPLQLAVGLSALANGGTVYVPHVAYEITDSSGKVIHRYEAEKRSELGISQANLNTIKEGMKLATANPNGTAYSAFKGFPYAVAGKTGTAQKKPEDDYALFIGYAPADNPQIVVVAIIEQGGHGSAVAAPVVRKVMEQFFHTGSTSGSVAHVTD